MDLQVLEPYAVHPEMKSKKPPVFTLPQTHKSLEFFSKVGKTRLCRICDDNKLNEEVIFTGGWAGPSESFVKERVSDFVQHHLFRRLRRVSLERHNAIVEQFTKPNAKFEKRPTVFVHYEEFVKKTNESLDKKRKDEEKERLVRMLISGEVHYVPAGFEWVLDDPYFKMNRIMERVRNLEQQDYSNLQPPPFSLKYIKPVRVVNDRNIVRKELYATKSSLITPSSTWISKLNSARKAEMNKLPNLESPIISTSLLLETDSSGVSENNWTPSPNIPSYTSDTSPRAVSAWTDEGIETGESNNEVFSSPALRKMNTFGSVGCMELTKAETSDSDRVYAFEDIQDEKEMWSIAKKLYPDEEFSGELEIIHANSMFQSKPVLSIRAEENCDKMYEVGSQVANLYERQEVVGMEFVEELSSQFFGK